MMKVKIFATHTCPYCKMEKAYLEGKGVAYENVYVDDDPAAAHYIVEKSGQLGVPVTEIKNDEGQVSYILGFNKPKLNEALGIVENRPNF